MSQSTETDQVAGQVDVTLTALREIAAEVCTCPPKRGPHAQMCPTRRIGKRVDRLYVLIPLLTTPSGEQAPR